MQTHMSSLVIKCCVTEMHFHECSCQKCCVTEMQTNMSATKDSHRRSNANGPPLEPPAQWQMGTFGVLTNDQMPLGPSGTSRSVPNVVFWSAKFKGATDPKEPEEEEESTCFIQA